jgi:hypothetical protein
MKLAVVTNNIAANLSRRLIIVDHITAAVKRKSAKLARGFELENWIKLAA